MPFERINVQLAIKLDQEGNLPPALLKKPTTAQFTAMSNMTWAEIIKEMIRQFKSYSSRINEGKDNEEMTVIARRHTCSHDITPTSPCVEEDI